jgi:hypothetical protein
MIAWLKRQRRKEKAGGAPPRINAPSMPLLIR